LHSQRLLQCSIKDCISSGVVEVANTIMSFSVSGVDDATGRSRCRWRSDPQRPPWQRNQNRHRRLDVCSAETVARRRRCFLFTAGRLASHGYSRSSFYLEVLLCCSRHCCPARLRLALQTLQIGSHFGSHLVAQVPIFLESLVDNSLQFYRQSGFRPPEPPGPCAESNRTSQSS